jgi:hypothetical protein
MALPAAAERGGRLKRDVLRLSALATALEAQLVEARLGVIGEGGEVRQIDLAVPQRQPAFPRPWLTMGIGTAGGLLVGMIAALFLGWFGRWLRDPVEIERALGISAQRFEPNAPLLLAGAASARSLLVIPLDARARVAAAVVNLIGGQLGSNGNAAEPARALIDQVEAASGMAIVCLPELGNDMTLSSLRETRPVVLVAAPGPVDRAQLAHAVDVLRRLQVPCAGVVLSNGAGPRTLL